MKIILDTNILVSALISTGFPSMVLNKALFSKNIFSAFLIQLSKNIKKY